MIPLHGKYRGCTNCLNLGATVADAISTSYRIMKNKGLAEEVPYVIHIGGMDPLSTLDTNS